MTDWRGLLYGLDPAEAEQVEKEVKGAISVEASQEIPAEVQAAAARLGVPPETLMAHLTPPITPDATQEQLLQTEAQVVPTETELEKTQRELAESRQETQQVRAMAQTAEAGRVIGSGGGGLAVSAVSDLPNLGVIEPGIRYEYLNGLITDQQLIEKVGPLLAALLKKHEGGTI